MTQPEALRLADEMERVAEYDHQVQAAAELRRLYKLKHPRQWQGLTDDEIEAMMDYWSDDARSAYGGARAANGEYVDIPDIIRDAEARLKEKNNGSAIQLLGSVG